MKQGGIAEKTILTGFVLSPLFIINWLHNTRMSVRGEYLLLFQTLVMVYLALSQKNRFFGLFLLWSIVSFYIFKFQGIFYLSMIFFGSLLFYIIYEKVINIELALKCIGLSAIMVIIPMIAQILGVLPLTIGNFTIGTPLRAESLNLAYNGVTGLLAQGNVTGAYLAICLLIFFVYYKRILGLVVVALIMTKCNGALIAGGVGAVFYYCFRPGVKIKEIVIVCLICLVLAGGFCFIDKPDYSTRLYAVKVVLTQTTGWNIITGHGLGSFSRLGLLGAPTGNPDTDWLKQAHNEYIQVYYELGLIGLGLILFGLGFLLNSFIRIFKRRTELDVMLFSCCVVIVVVSVFSFNFHHGLTSLIGISILSMCEKNLKREELV